MHSFLTHKYFIDLHVHTSRHSPCAEGLNPDMIPLYMKEKKLHGVVLAEHDTMWSEKDIASLNKGLRGIRIYRGIEVSSVDGHFLVIGMDQVNMFYAGMSVRDIVRFAEGQNAAVILAHHHRLVSNGQAVDILDMPDGIHAIEVISTITNGKNESEARKYARLKQWHCVAGSDAHHINNIGTAFTAFKKLPADDKELAYCIRSGSGFPMRSEKTRKHLGKNAARLFF